MKISCTWLKNYVETGLEASAIAKLLTDGGLEVESIEHIETVKGGLEGMVIGEVKSKEKHPDADRLSITTVDIGGPALLHIVCGASNVAAGQKVVVATEGARLYPSTGEPFVIKKSKIRGQASEGMICAEDEIGLGSSHDGIMVLDPAARVGMQASAYFKVEKDEVFELGLTPNRADAASHLGVARDLVALISCSGSSVQQTSLTLPGVSEFREGSGKGIMVTIENPLDCPRYSGVTISGVKVGESPVWLQNRLKAIGLRPINNIVDITNFVLHELGQPLHAFDAAKIKGGKVIVRKCPDKTKFTTLDGVERELSDNDLMICNAEEPMCIAGVFGGMSSGVSEQTSTVFLESAYFNPVAIRKSSRHHGLKTDASFRFERGTDPDMTVFALKRAALLICELCGGNVESPVSDYYPQPVLPFRIPFAFSNCDKLIGKKIPHETIKQIITSLGITIDSYSEDALLLLVPPRKVDVTRECDVIEEVLRVYGYNQIEIPNHLHASVSYTLKPDKIRLQTVISDLLSNNGFAEILNNSLTKGAYTASNPAFKPEQSVELMNPLSSDLNVLRQSLLFGGLEVISHNQKRQQADLKLYEFGRVYIRSANGFFEINKLGLFVCGSKLPEAWNAEKGDADFFYLKAHVTNIFSRLGIRVSTAIVADSELFSAALQFSMNKKVVGELGLLKRSVLKQTDTAGDVYYAELNWDVITASVPAKDIPYKELPKFPSVRRDLALVLDKQVQFHEVEQLAYQCESALLKRVSLFDVYEGDKIGSDKKSYAVSFTIQDEQATLTEKQIEKIMEKLMKTYQEKLGAIIRS